MQPLITLGMVIFLLASPLQSYTQVQMTLQKPPVRRLSVEHLWNLQINNTMNMNRRAYLMAEIINLEKDQQAARIRTDVFQLPMGLKRLDPQKITVTRMDYPDTETENIINRTNNFPRGHYEIRITLYNANDDSKIAETIQEHKVTNVYNTAKKAISGDDGKLVSFYGNGYIEARNADQQGFNQGIPQNYFRANMDATLEIGMAPIQFHGYYTSIQNEFRQNANAVTVSFDDQRFINNLRNRLTQVIKKETGLKQQEYSSAVNKLKKLENLDRLLKNQDIAKEIKEIGDLESIEHKLNDVDLQNAISRIKGVRNDIKNRISDLNYKARKQKLQTQLEVQKGISFADSRKEQKRKTTIDSLQNEMKQLEKEKQAVKEKNQADLKVLNKLQEQKNKFDRLKRKKQKVERLLEKKEQLKKLAEQKEKLEKYKQKLKETGGLEAIQTFNINKLNNKDILKNELLKRGMLSIGERLLYGIEELSAGTVYPYYSPLVLNGLRMTGVNFEWNPGIFYTAFSGGTSNRPRFSLENGIAEYRQRLIAGKIGFGKKHQTHIYFTALNAIDDRNSIPRDDTLQRPRSNLIFGTDIGLSLFKGDFNLQGEIAASKYNSDNAAGQLSLNNRFSEYVPDFLNTNVSSKYGLAYDLRGAVKLFKNHTVLSGFLRNIDPSYNSFGAPNLRTGLFTYNIKLSQRLFSRNLTLSLFRKNESTTRLWQDGLTHYERQGGELSTGFSGIPQLRISYAQSTQDKGQIFHDMSELMISASHSYQIGELSLSNSLNFNRNGAASSQANGPDYVIYNYLVNQMVSFPFPLSLSVNINYVDEIIQGVESERVVTDLSASFQLFKKVDIRMGGLLNMEPYENQKFGGFVDVNYAFARHFNFQLSFENNYYDDLAVTGNDFDEYILNSRLTMNW
jgi:hypothetical protein